MKPIGCRLWTLVSIFLFLLGSSPALQAQTITVTSAVPNNAPQGTVNLNVLVNGNGFKKGALAKFFISGTTDPGGIQVNSTAFINSGQLNANINVAGNAAVAKFDIVVALTNGSSGKGTQLFSVTAPDPAIAYITGAQFNCCANLMVMNADGTNQIALLQAADKSGISFRSPNWSPDGTQLVFESNIQGNGIYVINKDGSGLRKVIALNSGNGFGDPVWSPAPAADGKWKIAFVDDPSGSVCEDVFLVNLDGTGLQNLTKSPGLAEYYPTWDPYATRLASQVYACPSGITPHIYQYNLALVGGVVGISSSVNLTATGPLQSANVVHTDWAKTQDKIAVSALLSGATYRNIWVISLADPANPVNLTNSPNVSEVRPSWSPDDSKIVFSGGNIHTINADGTGLTDLGVAGGSPDWRRCCPTCAIACAP